MAIAHVCPKCRRERRAGEDACARCGLLVTRWEGWSGDPPAHPLLDGLWAACEADWEDPAAHERFLEQAVAAGGLDVAAARYRAAHRQRQGDARAEAGLLRATRLADAQLTALQIGRAGRTGLFATRWGGLLVGAAALAIALALFALALWPRAHR
jgi:hypothetical protein